MRKAFTVESVRAAESALLAQQRFPDELMRLAARGVAATAAAMLDAHSGRRVLVLVGPGGNGGDGLYAGAFLAAQGYAVDAYPIAGISHHSAGAAFSAAGGRFLKPEDTQIAELPDSTALLIDAVAGLASARGLAGLGLEFYRQAHSRGVPVLAIDMPTGIDADTGVAAADAVHATVTVSFGLARAGQIAAPECGEVVLCDLQLPGAARSFAEELEQGGVQGANSAGAPVGAIAYEPTLPATYGWPSESIRDTHGGWATAPRPVGCTGPIIDPTPRASSDKYSGGVAAICAGSKRYPGAGILAATGAVRATPSMVRVVGNAETVQHLPEVVLHADAKDVHAQCWVVGPGRGTDEAARAELEYLLTHYTQPLLVDADAITLLSLHPSLRQLLKAHGLVILSPHAGEFTRIYEATFLRDLDPRRGVAANVRELAAALGCFVLHKGRNTVVAGPHTGAFAFNAGHSYAATPGSGDVLSGIIGAVLAQLHHAGEMDIVHELLHAATIHQHAAAIAAQTPEGMGICSASQIAAAVPQAVARLLHAQR
ncbi:bifunctional ADP-dependent NAD(P)H-hydrate dehydratase/NAD(P)H-hydrate epimerase [Corynebacterium flavescens]|uniref:bifunctional ADP-dependent NAD(P)H-hydrate dehydratase/NAD(P)H-hydrate epimerase n=2 Tax=Corynebacterium flavescens TaxID=28028 RepID=UPI000EED04D2|nr:bifunctional ADP-dependent NAD(P)H-hydrate dehydratase/NAD(P)H-hydrate epimerase [Corynebacterium flavescens]MDN6099291.1 bifunctional ADP-dependent NAD(P)H-hydrate dehydratase/NAD(P)H-hydrate epimerase [Corynebacterium flavescens]MDN6199010.1 bifunctional ADP-dependent NAD(P)H-hydrate dehydratase/NAD(P)H-hydrate epimerase [Corynebacterium flavescens]MDN6225571.1 bifunctional ADP-dependent NAD(P)H-hydrate dehydratase/NAD(P)H-hydrate epimerase [Corynebacterium flavescens]MDN6430558.1 bifuncti